MNLLQKKKLKWAFVATVLCYAFSHGYRFFHTLYSGDSLLLVYQTDYAWEIALGRCFNPIWTFLRGTILSPWLLSALSMLFLTGTVYLITEYLQINDALAIVMIASVLTINSVLTCLNASFLPWADMYVLAIFLNTAGAYLLGEKKVWCFVTGSLLLALGLGTYQAYITVAVALIMIRVLLALSKNHDLKELLKELVRYGCGFVGAGVIYYGSWKLMQKILHIWTADGYNGMASLGDYSDSSFLSILAKTYGNFFSYFWNPDVFISLTYKKQSLSFLWVYLLRISYVAVLVLILWALFLRNKKYKTSVWHKILQVAELLVLPLGFNSICVLSKGMEHTLMIYSFLGVYVLLIRLLFDKERDVKKTRGTCLAGVVCLALICWVNGVFSNQVYLKKGLQEEATKSLMTRLVGEVEAYEGYRTGVTPVAFAGTFTEAPAVKEPDGLDDIVLYGMSNTPLFYHGTETAFLKYYLHSGMNLTQVDAQAEEIRQMPVYPAEGAIGYVGDTLVIKISD